MLRGCRGIPSSLPLLAGRWSIFRWLVGGNGPLAQPSSHQYRRLTSMRFSRRQRVLIGCCDYGCGPTGERPLRETPSHWDRQRSVPPKFGCRRICVGSMKTESLPVRLSCGTCTIKRRCRAGWSAFSRRWRLFCFPRGSCRIRRSGIHRSTAVEASSPSDAAQSAFPTLSKYVEVTGVRVFANTNNSEIRYVVVNHSAAELPPFQLMVKLRPKRGPAVCSFSAGVQGMGPNESREMHTTIRREVHSYDLPEWRDLRVEAHVTAK